LEFLLSDSNACSQSQYAHRSTYMTVFVRFERGEKLTTRMRVAKFFATGIKFGA